MDNMEVKPPEMHVHRKVFRGGSLAAMIVEIINSFPGAFSLQDLVARYNDECVKVQKEPGNAVRNIRNVVYTMLNEGQLIKLARSNWAKPPQK